MKNKLLRLLGSAPDALIQRAIGKECLLPYYHMVSDEYIPHVRPLYAYRNLERFKADLELLGRGRKALSLEEFLSAVHLTGSAPPNSFLLTFDDGFREMHDIVAPLLYAKGIPAVFFVMSEMVDNHILCFQQKISLLLDHLHKNPLAFENEEAKKRLGTEYDQKLDPTAIIRNVSWTRRSILDDIAQATGLDFDVCLHQARPYLSSDQITSLLKRGFAIGAHSINHPRYADIPLQEQLRQTRESMKVLADRFGLKNRTFAFPHTDEGVSRSFFQTIAEEHVIEASFGTAGPAKDSVASNFQRFSMEKPDLPGNALIARHGLRRVRYRMSGESQINRN